MARQLQLRGGTEAEHSTFTGAPRELTVDTTKQRLRLHDGVTVGGIQVGGTVTDTPVMTIVTSVNENSITSGSYTSSAGSEVTITAVKGTITNHDTVAKTFDYVAPDILDDLDTTDVISISATKAGEIRSDIGTVDMTIIFVPIVADDAISNADFATNESYNVGFTY